MMEKLSKWSILYFVFKKLLQQIAVILLMLNIFIEQENIPKYVLLMVFFLVVKIIRGFFMWVSTTFCVSASKIIINKGIFKKKQTEFSDRNIQGFNIKENWFYKQMGVFDLILSIKGNDDENLEVFLRCVPFKFKEKITANFNLDLRQDVETEGHSWEIDLKKIVLSSLTSITWTVFVSLVFIRGELEELEFIPIISVLLDTINNILLEEKYLWLSILLAFILGMIIEFAVNFLRYYNYKVCMDTEKLMISRGKIVVSKMTLKKKDIGSFLIVTSFLSDVVGYGKLLAAENKGVSEDKLAFTIFPFEKKEQINGYLEKWFKIEMCNRVTVKKERAFVLIEILIIGAVYALSITLANKYVNEYVIIWGVISTYILMNVIIKNLRTCIHITEKMFVFCKAGIKSKAFHIFVEEIVTMQVEDNFIQRRLGIADLKFDTISNSDGQSFVLRNIKKSNIDKILHIWRR